MIEPQTMYAGADGRLHLSADGETPRCHKWNVPTVEAVELPVPAPAPICLPCRLKNANAFVLANGDPTIERVAEGDFQDVAA